jgi:3-deoxy-manno-octulosonate cytidylyltransferase (CMP-KDO synthetase)
MKNVICIPVKMDFGRFPNKALADARGKPLIEWVVDAAKSSNLVDFVWVVTDSAEMVAWCQENGVKCRFSPVFAANGTDRVASFLLGEKMGHVPTVNDLEKVIVLPCDIPDVTGEMLDDLFLDIDAEADNHTEIRAVTLAYPLLDKSDFDSTTVVKTIVRDGVAHWFTRLPMPGAQHGHTGIYGYTWRSLLRYHCAADRHLESLEDLEQMRILASGGEIVAHIIEPIHSIKTAEDLARWNADVGTAAERLAPV